MFVDGCFWYGHDCGRNVVPKVNADRWREKIERNRRVIDVTPVTYGRRMGRVIRAYGNANCLGTFNRCGEQNQQTVNRV
ncbi:MAG: very short patch repair endonuclease [Acidimicrobiia bacterium]|nr:very short patch repair endonuclease [Acidimicrobiia bacterium]